MKAAQLQLQETDVSSGQQQGIVFLRALYLCRELSDAVSIYCGLETLDILEAAAVDIGDAPSTGDEGLAFYMHEIARLVLASFDHSEFPFTCPPTEAGSDALAVLQRLVYGADSLGASLASTALSGTLAQACLAKDLCVAALMHAVGPQNCLSLLKAAQACGCGPLYLVAESFALSHFSAALCQDAAGLDALSEEQLYCLLTSDDLAVDSEIEAFKALQHWIEADMPERLGRFVDMFCRCVRFPVLKISELEEIMDSQLLVLERKGMELVAHAIIHCFQDQPHAYNKLMGREVASQPRNCQKYGPGHGQELLVEIEQKQPVDFKAVLFCVLLNGRMPRSLRSPVIASRRKGRESPGLGEDVAASGSCAKRAVIEKLGGRWRCSGPLSQEMRRSPPYIKSSALWALKRQSSNEASQAAARRTLFP